MTGTDGEAEGVVPPRDTEALRAALEEPLENPTKRLERSPATERNPVDACAVYVVTYAPYLKLFYETCEHQSSHATSYADYHVPTTIRPPAPAARRTRRTRSLVKE